MQRTPGVWTQTPISAWLVSVPNDSIIAKRPMVIGNFLLLLSLICLSIVCTYCVYYLVTDERTGLPGWGLGGSHYTTSSHFSLNYAYVQIFSVTSVLLPIKPLYFFYRKTVKLFTDCQWRRLHRARGHVPPTFANGWERGGAP